VSRFASIWAAACAMDLLATHLLASACGACANLRLEAWNPR
jgi:hypothetical protein